MCEKADSNPTSLSARSNEEKETNTLKRSEEKYMKMKRAN